MSQEPKVGKAVGDTGDEAGIESVAPPSRLAAIGAMIRGPKQKLFILGGAGLLTLIAMIALGVLLLRKPKVVPTPVPVVPVAIVEERPKEQAEKSAVEERFDAMKRGDFSARPAKREVPEAVPRNAAVPSQAAAVQPPRSAPETPPPATSTEATPTKSAMRQPGECEVGSSDPKGSAAAILSCILQFNAIDGRDRPPKVPKKTLSGN